jgi:putative ABC transport system permease protein
MNAAQLSIASIKNRKLPSFLCVLAVACGIALLTSVFLLFSAAENGLMKNAAGVDVVVGAKGSTLQLVLSTIYHGDIPTGNIDMHEAEEISRNPNVKHAIPLAIGDNYKGFRVIGTTPEYLNLYKGEIAEGKKFGANYETVVGAKTGLALGEEFAARHGFSADSDDVHDDHMYNVVGILKPTGTVLDKLILTPYQSVQDLHSHHDEEEDGSFAHQITFSFKSKHPPRA